MMIGYKYRLSAGSRKTGPSSGGNSSKSNKTQPQTATGLFIRTVDGRVEGRQTIRPTRPAGCRNITTDENSPKFWRGGKSQHQERSRNLTKQRKWCLFVWSNYILYWHKGLAKKRQRKKRYKTTFVWLFFAQHKPELTTQSLTLFWRDNSPGLLCMRITV